jgi:hypothetical protein
MTSAPTTAEVEACMGEARNMHTIGSTRAIARALSRRAVACKGWRWKPGMLAYFHDGRYTRVSMPDAWASTTALPDLTDPATLGCLLALVREAWEPHGTFVSTHRYDGGEWSIRTLPLPVFATEAEALVAALEAAP